MRLFWVLKEKLFSCMQNLEAYDYNPMGDFLANYLFSYFISNN